MQAVSCRAFTQTLIIISRRTAHVCLASPALQARGRLQAVSCLRVACSNRPPYWITAQLSMIPERYRPRPSANKERRTTQNKVRLLFQFSVCHGLQELRGPHLRVPFTRCTRCLPCHIPGTVELWLVELSPLFAGCSILARPSHIRRRQLIIEPYLQSRSLFGIN